MKQQEIVLGTSPIIAYKGFDRDLKCRDFQYEVGKEYENADGASACNHGFHACEYPLDVFTYYSPAGSRFALVEQTGVISRHEADSKVASSKIKVTAEIGLPDLIKAAIEWTVSRAKPEDMEHSTGDYGAASNTGYRGAASTTGEHAVVMASGYAGMAKGTEGCALFLVRRNNKYEITKVGAAIVGEDGIEADVWYSLDANGKFIKSDLNENYN